jgi:hypothetical protein
MGETNDRGSHSQKREKREEAAAAVNPASRSIWEERGGKEGGRRRQRRKLAIFGGSPMASPVHNRRTGMELAIGGGGGPWGEVNNWPGQMMAKAAGAFRERRAVSLAEGQHTQKIRIGNWFFLPPTTSVANTQKSLVFLYIYE